MMTLATTYSWSTALHSTNITERVVFNQRQYSSCIGSIITDRQPVSTKSW